MADTPKKPSTRKKTSASASATKEIAPKRKTSEKVTAIGISHEEIARLAHQYWTERGRQHGTMRRTGCAQSRNCGAGLRKEELPGRRFSRGLEVYSVFIFYRFPYAIRPSLIVQRTFPCIDQPSNGVLCALDRVSLA